MSDDANGGKYMLKPAMNSMLALQLDVNPAGKYLVQKTSVCCPSYFQTDLSEFNKYDF